MQNFDGKHEDISVVCTLQQGCAKRDDLFIQLQLLKNTENVVTLSLRLLSPFQSLLRNSFHVVPMFTKHGYMMVWSETINLSFESWDYLFNAEYLNSLSISHVLQVKPFDGKAVLTIRTTSFFSCWTQLFLRFSQQRFTLRSLENFVFNFYTKSLMFYYRTGWRFLNLTNRSSLNMALSSFQTPTHQQMKTTTLIAK